MGETSKFELTSRKTTGQVKNSMGLDFLVNQRLNCTAGFRAMGQSLWTFCCPIAVLHWGRGQPIALYIILFPATGICSMF